MFNYGELSNLEKEIVLLIGDNIKNPPLEPHSNIKNRKKLFNDFLSTTISEQRFEEILTDLYLKGLLSFSQCSINIVNNLAPNSKQMLENEYDKSEKGWREQCPHVRLTTSGERTISGSMVYSQLTQDDINEKYTKINKAVSDLEKNLNSINSKHIELMAIFIAIFTFIIGNTSLFSAIKQKSLIEVLFFVCLTNGSILLGISFLLISVRTLIFGESFKKEHLAFLIVPIVLIVTAIFIG